MANSVNKLILPVATLIQYQKRDQIFSLTIKARDDLMQFDELTNGINDVMISLFGDAYKENVINITNTGDGGVTASITHGTNNENSPSTIIIDSTSLATRLSNIEARLTALEQK